MASATQESFTSSLQSLIWRSVEWTPFTVTYFCKMESISIRSTAACMLNKRKDRVGEPWRTQREENPGKGCKEKTFWEKSALLYLTQNRHCYPSFPCPKMLFNWPSSTQMRAAEEQNMEIFLQYFQPPCFFLLYHWLIWLKEMQERTGWISHSLFRSLSLSHTHIILKHDVILARVTNMQKKKANQALHEMEHNTFLSLLKSSHRALIQTTTSLIC